jgi:hypothetical protein
MICNLFINGFFNDWTKRHAYRRIDGLNLKRAQRVTAVGVNSEVKSQNTGIPAAIRFKPPSQQMRDSQDEIRWRNVIFAPE